MGAKCATHMGAFFARCPPIAFTPTSAIFVYVSERLRLFTFLHDKH